MSKKPHKLRIGNLTTERGGGRHDLFKFVFKKYLFNKKKEYIYLLQIKNIIIKVQILINK